MTFSDGVVVFYVLFLLMYWLRFVLFMISLAMSCPWVSDIFTIFCQLFWSGAEWLTSYRLAPLYSVISSTHNLCGCPLLLFPSISTGVFNFRTFDICAERVVLLTYVLIYKCGWWLLGVGARGKGEAAEVWSVIPGWWGADCQQASCQCWDQVTHH